MKHSEDRPIITEDDVEVRNIKRRTFLGRFGVAAGLVGIAGMTQACASGESSDGEAASDADQAPSEEAPAPDSTEEASDADQSSDTGS